MANRFASGKHSIAECDRCGQRYKLKILKRLIVKTKNYEMLVCPTCWDPDQPQLQLGMYPVDDPQALRNPRPDSTYQVAGTGPAGRTGDAMPLGCGGPDCIAGPAVCRVRPPQCGSGLQSCDA